MTKNAGERKPPLYEAEVIPGLESFAIEDLRVQFGPRIAQVNRHRAGFIRFRFRGRAPMLRALRSVIAVYRVDHFPLPRPKAFLGHQHFSRLTQTIREVAQSFSQPPQTLGVGAAGSHSSVMRRLLHELARALQLAPARDGKGELFLRLLPNREAAGWEALLRISPQPLSAREYRLFNMPGSLNATVAYAMTRIEALAERATVVNLCSGASTILIEHGQTQRRHRLLAIDRSETALEAGRRNAKAAGLDRRVLRIQADAARTPLPARVADRIYADLPFGHHVGSHESNLRLYPALLQEADRLARSDAAFVVLTHEVKLLRRCLKQSPWAAASETRINLRGLHPRLFVLRRNSTRI